MSLGDDCAGNQNMFEHNSQTSESPYKRMKRLLTLVLSQPHPVHSFALLFLPVILAKATHQDLHGTRNVTLAFGFPGHQEIRWPISHPDCSCRNYN